MRHFSAVLFLSCAALGLAACNRSGDAQDFQPTATTFLTGTSMIPPDLEGTWVVQSTPVASACGALNVLFATPTILTVGPPSRNAFDFTAADSCGRPIPEGNGTVDTAGNVRLTTDSRRRLTATCVLKLVQKRHGAVESPANIFSGTDVLEIAKVDQPGSDACDPTLPCTVSGTFTATRCPASGCSVTCTP
jgi:hypothetical protein